MTETYKILVVIYTAPLGSPGDSRPLQVASTEVIPFNSLYSAENAYNELCKNSHYEITRLYAERMER